MSARIRPALAADRDGSLVGAHVTMRYKRRDLLGTVLAVDGRGDKRRLVVRHFNGDEWPLEPLLEYDMVGVLVREYESEDPCTP